MPRSPAVAFGLVFVTSFGSAATARAQVFSSPAAVNSNAAIDSGIDVTPQIVTDRAGHWIAAWNGSVNDVLVSRSADNGATWTSLAAINTPATRGGAVQLATDAAGIWVAVWEAEDPLGGSDIDLFTSRSLDAGATWSLPVALNTNAATDSGLDLYPELTTDGAGIWIAVWASADSLGGTIGTDFDILFARSTDGGVTWSPPAPLNTNAATDVGFDREPDIVTDGMGTWCSVWRSGDALGGTIGADDDILIARSTDGGVTWSLPSPLNTNAGTDTGNDYNPRLATDGSGNWVAVWTSKDSLGGTIGTDEDILTATSTDGGVTWTAPAALNTNAATDVGNDAEPQITTDGHGRWVAIWYGATLESARPSDDDIRIARSTDIGTRWSLPVPLNNNAAHDRAFESDPQLATDGAGTWLAVWDTQDSLGGTIGNDFDIVAARGTTVECAEAPLTGCASPPPGQPRNSLLLRNFADDGKDLVIWKWSAAQMGGLAAFGDPSNGDVLTGTNYRLCLYDGGSGLLLTAAAGAGGVCRKQPCWKAVPGKGFSYRDAERTPGGLAKIGLRASADQVKILLKGRGPYLDMPALGSVVLPLRAQLQAGNGSCWEATFSMPLANDAQKFRSRAD
jgi:hypothetical protein